MKTIFSYLAKCFVTYTLSFALLQVQVFLPIENLRHASGNVMAANDGVTLGEDGVATKSGSVDLKNEKGNALLDHLSMLAFGFFTSRALMICKPLPMDVMIAAAGGVIYIGGELYTFNAFKDLKSKDKVTYNSREDGENEKQIEILEAQKKGYDDIAKTAKTKAMIQMAAGAAYGISAGYALLKSAEFGMETAHCGTCSVTTAIAAKLELEKFDPSKPSAVTAPVIYGLCTAMEAGALSASLEPSCTQAEASCVLNAATCSQEVMICNPSGATIMGSNTPDAFQKFASKGLKFPEIESVMDDNFIAETIKETYLEGFQREFQLSSFIDKSNPFYDLNKKMEFDETNFETQVNSYARNRDMSRYYQGEISSMSVEEFSSFKKSMFELEVGSSSDNLGESLKLVLHSGIDLIIPNTHAGSMMTMLGGVAGIALALFKTTSYLVDNFMATPGNRGLIWIVGAGLALVASNSSKKIQESAEKNSGKIQEIINKLNSQGQKNVDSLGGNRLAIPSQIPFKLKGNAPLSIGPDKAPCADKPGTSGCGSLRSGIEKNAGFASLGGSFGALAGTAGAAADGVTGSDNIPSASVDGLVQLSKENNAVQKKLRAVQRKFNQALKESGKSPLDFEKLNENILAKLRKNTQAALAKSGKSAADVLAALGPVANSKEEEKPKVAATPKNEKLKMTSGTAKKNNGGFKLDLENEGSNDALQSDEVLANQAAANALNGEAQDDIVANKDVSIFKVISVRYLKSGFNKLLDEEVKK
ncbi:hypothetical protein [Halobacteriovorax sp. JY17]|uniref:hypothetical protein n=1 Tax=Halobacteriovorax sp. JY17 TaxID=2014617 RepID=UPI000C60CE53|nr:hypothetical protein [Halobacteriovorax sp. JY17]PIK14994.1 MAG: hypothetical protein CES88_11715 [Halobacteriovorax sp. JY17]